MSQLNHFYGKQLLGYFPKAITQVYTSKGELTIVVDSNKVSEVLNFLKNHSGTQFKVLTEICGVDYPSRRKRFEVVYCLLSLVYNVRIRVKTMVDEVTPLDSVTDLYSGAN